MSFVSHFASLLGDRAVRKLGPVVNNPWSGVALKVGATVLGHYGGPAVQQGMAHLPVLHTASAYAMPGIGADTHQAMIKEGLVHLYRYATHLISNKPATPAMLVLGAKQAVASAGQQVSHFTNPLGSRFNLGQSSRLFEQG